MFRSLLSIVLSLLFVAPPAWAIPTGDQPAGEVKALIPDASRNAQPLTVKDTLQWNDLLKTDVKGRLRAGLTDGSILSLGSNSELKVVQHDATAQQTLIEMNYGKLRSQVVKITNPSGKYEVKTPNAVIGVIGTDFYVAYDNNRTTVICYQGQLTVTLAASTTVTLTLNAGQMVEVSGKDVMGQPSTAPPAVVQTTIGDTNIPALGKKQAGVSTRTKIIVATAMIVTAGLTVALTQINSSSKPCGCK
ncbi:MAG: FecR domain-containing protein [Candidatus Korobacteraceae bacterium]|jgi:hypothetical protein